jgi:hypothetical protein
MTRSPFNGYNVKETTEIMREHGRQAMQELVDTPAIEESIKAVAQRASRCVIDKLFAAMELRSHPQIVK